MKPETIFTLIIATFVAMMAFATLILKIVEVARG
jgi:hypothetical protein